MHLRPQVGPQEAFLSSPADIAIYGGAAGGGKSFAILMEPLRHVIGNAAFSAVFFRRTTVQIRNPGGLWDASMRVYPYVGGTPVAQVLEWRFSGGGKIKFAHLEHESNVLDWQGSEIPLICFDELTHFTEAQFWYLLSRNRSMCGVKPYIRATCNPDAGSWVARLISWWIDQETGLPLPERGGSLRWFIRVNDTLIWADSPDDLRSDYPDIPPKSLTFIPSKLTDNPALMSADPGYLANLMALPLVERERLLGGNWKIKPESGMYFRPEMFKIVDALPAGGRAVRGWDLAATMGAGDWTVGVKLVRYPDGSFVVADVVRGQYSTSDRDEAIYRTASQDGYGVTIGFPQDPGAGGKAQIVYLTTKLAGYSVQSTPETGSKEVRASPVAAQAQVGNIVLLSGRWNEEFLNELRDFPSDGVPDDQVDALSRAFGMLVGKAPMRISPEALIRFAGPRPGVTIPPPSGGGMRISPQALSRFRR